MSSYFRAAVPSFDGRYITVTTGPELQDPNDRSCLDTTVQINLPPVPMVLFCPSCTRRHIDQKELGRHKTHACQLCGFLWQPALVDTVGVQFLPGCKDEE